jgi:hypothetical protein
MESRTWPADRSAGRARCACLLLAHPRHLSSGRAAPLPGPRRGRTGAGLAGSISTPDCVIMGARRSSIGVPNHTIVPGQTTHRRPPDPHRRVGPNHALVSAQTTLSRPAKPHGPVSSNHTVLSRQTTRCGHLKPHQRVYRDEIVRCLQSAAHCAAYLRRNRPVHGRKPAPACLVKPHVMIASNLTTVSMATRSLGPFKVPHSVRHACGATDRFIADPWFSVLGATRQPRQVLRAAPIWKERCWPCISRCPN